MYFSDDVIEVCDHCHGIRPCWCDKKEEDKKYIRMWRWVYDLIKQLKPM